MISPEKKAKLVWNCRRGMLELDLLLNAFLTKCIDTLNDEQTKALEEILTYPDPDLYAWLMGYESPIKKEHFDIVTLMRSYDKI